MISFIIHIRKDTEERVKNLHTVLAYYKQISPDSEFVFVEDDNIQNFSFLKHIPNVKYIFMYNDTVYNKSKGYNIGLKNATYNNICFLDIDGVISKLNLLKAIDVITTTSKCLCLGYNGTCMYFNYVVKNQIPTTPNNLYDFLDSYVDKSQIRSFYMGVNYSIPNLKAMGGCLFGTKSTFEYIGGFNPNMNGWGFEDTEIIDRAKILKVQINAINTTQPYFFHLPHDEDMKRRKEDHIDFDKNHNENKKICSMNESQLKQYISTWLK